MGTWLRQQMCITSPLPLASNILVVCITSLAVCSSQKPVAETYLFPPGMNFVSPALIGAPADFITTNKQKNSRTPVFFFPILVYKKSSNFEQWYKCSSYSAVSESADIIDWPVRKFCMLQSTVCWNLDEHDRLKKKWPSLARLAATLSLRRNAVFIVHCTWKGQLLLFIHVL